MPRPPLGFNRRTSKRSRAGGYPSIPSSTAASRVGHADDRHAVLVVTMLADIEKAMIRILRTVNEDAAEGEA
jgi:hypothetical protein